MSNVEGLMLFDEFERVEGFEENFDKALLYCKKLCQSNHQFFLKDKLPLILAPMGTTSFFAFPKFSTDNKFYKQKRYSGQREHIF